VFLSVWRTVAASQGTVSGLTVNDFTTYYLVLLIVDKLTSEITIHVTAYKIQDGTLSSELLRPIHPILTSTLMYNMAFKALTFMAMVPVWVALVLLFRPDFSGITATNLLLAVPAILVGASINYLFGAIITCIAFWTTRVYSIAEMIWAFILLLGGTFVPLELLPGIARQAAEILPFQLYVYFPVQLILGRLEAEVVLRNFLLQGFWLVVTLVAFQIVWREGVKRFSAVGA